MLGFPKKQNKATQTETEYWEKRNREDYAKELMYDWNRWDNVEKLNPYAIKILNIATASHPHSSTSFDYREGIDKLDIEMHTKLTAYALITHQPQTHRQTIIPEYEKNRIFWRCIQIILFFSITFELCPEPDSDSSINGLLTACLFLAFTVISAYCRHTKQREYEIARDRATLNAIVNEDNLAAYLRTPECEEYMRHEYNKPECPHKNAIRTYLTWYGKEEYSEHITNNSKENNKMKTSKPTIPSTQKADTSTIPEEPCINFTIVGRDILDIERKEIQQHRKINKLFPTAPVKLKKTPALSKKNEHTRENNSGTSQHKSAQS